MSDWFKVYRSYAQPMLRLFCFPYAGGSAQVFADWSSHLPAGIDLFAIQAPGRGRRFSETPIACLKQKVQALQAEIKPYTDVPFIFVGHSNGALLAFELARALQKTGHDQLKHIVLSAKRAPHLPKIKEPIHHLPQAEFINKLKEYDFTPDEVLQNDELMELFSPMLRADFSLSETLEFDQSYPLNCNASLFWGNKDVDVPLEDVLAWKDVINGDVDVVEFYDGHFFIAKSQDLFLQQINGLIEKTV